MDLNGYPFNTESIGQVRDFLYLHNMFFFSLVNVNIFVLQQLEIFYSYPWLIILEMELVEKAKSAIFETMQ